MCSLSLTLITLSTHINTHPNPASYSLISLLRSPPVTGSMVISADKPHPPPDPMPNPTGPPPPPPPRSETQSHLHNFSFPVLKTWGTHRLLRCLNVNRKGQIIRSAADEPEAEELVKVPEATIASPPRELAPWNLRTKRTPVKDPSEEKAAAVEAAPAPAPHVRTVRLRSENVEKRERARFSITLTREEIDEDIYEVTGSTARRRPRKRPRNVQKQFDMLFPGSWLSEITADSYKVPD